MPKQRAKLLELCVNLLVRCKAYGIPLRAQRFSADIGVGIRIRRGTGTRAGIGFTVSRKDRGD